MTAAIDITTAQRKTLLALLRRFIPGVAVWAYGSRVKWTARPNSDLDLVAFTTPAQSPIVSELKEALAESNLPFLVDLHVWDEVPERFHEIIRKEYVILQGAEEKREDSGISFDYPSIRVGELADSISETHKMQKEHLIFLNTSDILHGKILHRTYTAVKDWPGQAKKSIRKSDILFSEIRPANGRWAYVDEEAEDFVVSTKLMVIRARKDRVFPKFLYQFLTSKGITSWLQHLAESRSGTFPQITFDEVASLELPLPPLAEQKTIAQIIGALDDKIELNRRMNATLEAMARALFQSWFVDFDPVRAKLDGCQPSGLDAATAALFPVHFQDSTIGPIPQGWEVGTIEDATALIIDYRGRTPKKMGSDWSVTGIPAVSAKNVKAGRLVRHEMFNFVSEELYDRWMKDKLAIGDILMTSEAPLGELYYLALEARFCLSQRIFALRANPSCCEPTFLYYWLELPACQTEIINRGTGTTVEGIRQSELRKVSVLLPPLPIQRAAAKLLISWTEQIHRNEEQSRTLATLRDTLLPKLLSGELSVARNELANHIRNQ